MKILPLSSNVYRSKLNFQEKHDVCSISFPSQDPSTSRFELKDNPRLSNFLTTALGYYASGIPFTITLSAEDNDKDEIKEKIQKDILKAGVVNAASEKEKYSALAELSSYDLGEDVAWLKCCLTSDNSKRVIFRALEMLDSSKNDKNMRLATLPFKNKKCTSNTDRASIYLKSLDMIESRVASKDFAMFSEEEIKDYFYGPISCLVAHQSQRVSSSAKSLLAKIDPDFD